MPSRTDGDSPSARKKEFPSDISRPMEVASASRGNDTKVQDVYCGISRLCRRPATPSRLTAPGAASAESGGLDRSCSLTFNSTFNPCYTSSTPPDNDDDECDDFNVDDLISSTFGKRLGRQGGYEMSRSCFEGQASADNRSALPTATTPAAVAPGFRPASWAGPPSGIVCSHSSHAGFASPTPGVTDLRSENKIGIVEPSHSTAYPASRLTTSDSSRSASDSMQPFVEDVHYYWELESTRTSAGPTLHLHNPSLMLEFNQRPIVPIQMGTQLRMAEAHQAGAAALPQANSSSSLSMPAEAGAKSKLSKAPQMGRCAVFKPAGSDCCADATVRSALLVPVPKCDPTARTLQQSAASGEVKAVSDLQFKEVKMAKPYRCPTPPRILSPAEDGETCEVAIADI
jgi:hypothetical protein